ASSRAAALHRRLWVSTAALSGQANQPLSDVAGLHNAPTEATDGSPQRTSTSQAKRSAAWSRSGGVISTMWPNTLSARGLAASSSPAFRSLLLVSITETRPGG